MPRLIMLTALRKTNLLGYPVYRGATRTYFAAFFAGFGGPSIGANDFT